MSVFAPINELDLQIYRELLKRAPSDDHHFTCVLSHSHAIILLFDCSIISTNPKKGLLNMIPFNFSTKRILWNLRWKI